MENPSGSLGQHPESEVVITQSMQAKIHRNRERALALRKARLAKKPYDKTNNNENESKEVDTGAGFFLEVVDDSDTHKRIVEEPGKTLINCHYRCFKHRTWLTSIFLNENLSMIYKYIYVNRFDYFLLPR